MMGKCAEVLILALLAPTRLEHRVEKQFAWAQFTYEYSRDEWCVDAQRRDAQPGEMVGGCWKTLPEAEQGIVQMRSRKK